MTQVKCGAEEVKCSLELTESSAIQPIHTSTTPHLPLALPAHRNPQTSLSSRVLFHPRLDLRNLGIDDRLHAGIRNPVRSNQITTMIAPRDDIHGRLSRADQRTTRSEVTGRAGGAPRVVLPVRPEQAGGGGEVPAEGAGVDLGLRGAVSGAEGEEGGGWEVEGALALPVGGGHEAGDYGGAGVWCAAGEWVD